jgi:tRNA uridine 5-carbamoylmethylation protein Kti12
MQSVKKIFFIPVGLPGMGKSTFAKHVRQTIETNFTQSSVMPNLLTKTAVLQQTHLTENL